MNKRIAQINCDCDELKANIEKLQVEKIAKLEENIEKEREANTRLEKQRAKEITSLKRGVEGSGSRAQSQREQGEQTWSRD